MGMNLDVSIQKENGITLKLFIRLERIFKRFLKKGCKEKYFRL